jgi:mannitol/fructose-specific phosphotransferase system IIA component (Ntr-type)
MKKIHEILTIDRIINITSVTKNKVLAEMCRLVSNAPEVTSPDALLRAIKAREAIMSTGIGMGIAIPHAKISSVTDFVMAVGISKDGINYQSLDDLPVYFIILIVASDTQAGDFLKLLGKIGAFFNTPGNKEKFLKTKSPAKVLSLFKKIDK